LRAKPFKETGVVPSSATQNGIIMNSQQNPRLRRLANGLGWFSIGLGVTEIVAPGTLARFIGIRDRRRSRTTMRMYGLREVAAGVGILSRSRPAPWLWARVAGDALDLASLGKTLASGESNRVKAGLATAAVAGVTAADVLCARQMGCASNGSSTTVKDVQLMRTINIDRSPEEIYNYWRDLNNLPRFMKHLASVERTGQNQSHWVINAPGGKKIEWDAQIEEDEPNRRIAWRSWGGSDVDHSGSVQFERAPGGRGTFVRVNLSYTPPGGLIGSTLAKWFGQAPGLLVEENLRALKQVLETGEIARSDASIHPGMHSAQPSAQAATA
jgi:uncharacterized membrane protein